TWWAGTRESEQPIHRYSGACCSESCPKKPGSSRETRSAQARLRFSRWSSRFIAWPSILECWQGRAERRVCAPEAHCRRCRPAGRSEEHTSELQSRENLVCRLLLEKKK